MGRSVSLGKTSEQSGFGLLLLVFLLILSCFQAQAADSEATVLQTNPPAVAKFAVLAFRPKPETLARWQPVVDYLNQAGLNRRIELVAYTYKELEAAVAAKQVDFVLTQPAHYIILTYAQGLYSPLATLVEQEGGYQLAKFGGVIISRSERDDLVNIADLRGKKVAVSTLSSLGSYQMQARELLRHDLSAVQEMQIVELGQPQDKSVYAVLNGEADVAFIRTGLIEAMVREGKFDLSRLKVINPQKIAGFPFLVSTPLYPEWPLSAMPWTDGDLSRQVAAAILGMPHGGPQARAAAIHGFTIPGDYRPVDELLRELHLPPFAAPTKLAVRDVWQQYSALIIGLVALITALLSGIVFALHRSNVRLRQEKIRTHEQLDLIAATEARQQTILVSLGEGVFGVDMAGLCTFINPMALNMLGWQSSDVIGKNQHAVFHHHHVDGRPYHSVDCPILQTCQDGLTRRQEECFWRKDGSSFLVQLTVTPQLKNGQVMGAVVVFMDITEHNRIAQELNAYRLDLEKKVQERTAELGEARQVAEAASAAKSTFLANMSHEIRTPIAAILGMARLMRKGGLSLAQEDRLNKIDNATQHLLAVINDILDFSKIEAGKMTLDEAPLNVAELVDGAVAMLAQRAAEKDLLLLVEVDRFHASLLGDSTRLRQSLLNFLSNAIKFTQKGCVCVRVRSMFEDDNSLMLRFEVEDTGIGIPADKIGLLFTAFQQADNSMTREYGGTGLGLAVTRRLAEMMGGSAGAESELGVGSTFWFTALLRKSVAKQIAALPPVLSSPSAVDLSNRRILVAEDEPINQEILLEILAELNLTVEVANDGLEALELAKKSRYDLILMDMQMPKMDGVLTTAAIRQLAGQAATPIIATTANAFAEDRARCLAAGMNDFIAKPIDPAELIAMIRRWLT